MQHNASNEQICLACFNATICNNFSELVHSVAFSRVGVNGKSCIQLCLPYVSNELFFGTIKLLGFLAGTCVNKAKSCRSNIKNQRLLRPTPFCCALTWIHPPNVQVDCSPWLLILTKYGCINITFWEHFIVELIDSTSEIEIHIGGGQIFLSRSNYKHRSQL